MSLGEALFIVPGIIGCLLSIVLPLAVNTFLKGAFLVSLNEILSTVPGVIGCLISIAHALIAIYRCRVRLKILHAESYSFDCKDPRCTGFVLVLTVKNFSTRPIVVDSASLEFLDEAQRENSWTACRVSLGINESSMRTYLSDAYPDTLGEIFDTCTPLPAFLPDQYACKIACVFRTRKIDHPVFMRHRRALMENEKFVDAHGNGDNSYIDAESYSRTFDESIRLQSWTAHLRLSTAPRSSSQAPHVISVFPVK